LIFKGIQALLGVLIKSLHKDNNVQLNVEQFLSVQQASIY